MRKRWVLAGAAVLVAGAATGGLVFTSGAKQATAAGQEPPVNTATVEKGRLSATVSQYGTLNYRARVDGSPYSAINRVWRRSDSMPTTRKRPPVLTPWFSIW